MSTKLNSKKANNPPHCWNLGLRYPPGSRAKDFLTIFWCYCRRQNDLLVSVMEGCCVTRGVPLGNISQPYSLPFCFCFPDTVVSAVTFLTATAQTQWSYEPDFSDYELKDTFTPW